MKNNLYKKSIASIIIFLLLTNLFFPIVYAIGDDEYIQFTDEELENEIINNGRDSNWESIDKDENGKISKQEMESMFELSASCWDIKSIEDLKYAKNLKFLNFYNYDGNFDLSIIKQLTTLINLSVGGYGITVENMSDILESLPNLSSLGLNIYNDEYLDIAKLAPVCSNIEELSITGKLLNIPELSKMPKLRFLHLRNEGTTPTVEEIANVTKKLPLEEYSIGSKIEVDLGTLQEGTNVVKNFADISSIMVDVFDENNYLYSPEIEFYSGGENLQINNSNKTISISPDSIGEHWSYVYCNCGKFDGEIELKWRTIPKGDTETEINIPDPNLKEILVNEHNVDGKEIITEVDLKSVEYLNLCGDWEKNVTNLEGLQYMTNLKELYVDGHNEVSIDLTPIYGLKNIERLYITNSKIKDISFLQNFTKLTYANLTGNPINPDDETNKIVIQAIEQRGGSVELSFYDTTPNINFVNTKLKESLAYQPYQDLNMDGEISEYEMSVVNYINVEGKIDDLKYATNVKYVYVQVNGETGDISSIFNLQNIEDLSISVNYTQTPIKLDLTNINKLTKLKRLSLYTNNSEVNINDFPQQLEDFAISNWSKTINLDKISLLKNLVRLQLNGKKIENFGLISNFTNLETLEIYIDGSNTVDITPISQLKKLKRLSLQNNRISDLSFLLNFDNLMYADLKGNPINPEDETNKSIIQAIEQRGGTVELSFYDTTPNINFVNTKLKESLVGNGRYYDRNEDGEISEYEMSQISYISVTGILDDLKYATNLQNLSININNETENLNILEKLNNLTSLSIYQYNSGENQNIEMDVSSIYKLKNLKELSISTRQININFANLPKGLERLSINSGSQSFNMENISSLNNLKYLSVNTYKIENLEKISNLTNLTELGLYLNSIYSSDGGSTTEVLDISKLEKLVNLTSLDVRGNIINSDYLKKLTNLKELSISNYDSENTEVEKMVKTLNEMNLEQLRIYGSYFIDLGTFKYGSQHDDLNIKDLNAITKAIYEKGNIFYIENPQWQTNLNNGDSSIQKLPIATSKVGYNEIYLHLNNYNSNFSGSLYIKWNVVEDGDKTKEINIPDENFRKVLLDRYDIDGNKKITEHDLINIDDMDIGMCGIKSLEGIQNCKNLQTLYAMDNEISDLTPIANIESIEYAVFRRNIIQNIDGLEDAKVPLSRIDLSENYIDTSKGSKAYNILKKSYINEMKNDEKIAQYINDNDILEQIDNYIINSQNYGKFEDRKQEVSMEDAMRLRLIELGLDRDHNGKLTREELYHAQNEIYELDLSGLGIKDITPLKYINTYAVDLSNNNITDISALANKRYYYIDLSNNKISNISVIKDLYDLTRIDLSNNNISNITALANMPCIRYKNIIEIGEGSKIYVYKPQYGMGVEFGVSVNLTQNYIDVNEDSTKNTLASIDTEFNEIVIGNQKEKAQGLIGDLNGDEDVTAKDLNMLFSYLNGKTELSDAQVQRADVTGDGDVTAKDLNRLYSHINGKNPLF